MIDVHRAMLDWNKVDWQRIIWYRAMEISLRRWIRPITDTWCCRITLRGQV